MRVTCPECEAKFKVPDKALGTTGRKLRCGSCSHQWMQAPPPAKPAKTKAAAAESPGKAKPKKKAKSKPKPEPEDVAPEEDEEPAFDEDLEQAELRAQRDEDALDPPPLGGVSRFRGPRSAARPKRQVPVTLLVLLATALAVPSILFAARGSLVEAWPASALLYDTVHLHVDVPGEGLVLQNVYVQRRQEGSVSLLVVAGEVRNPTEHLRSLPALRGTVLNQAGDTLQSWLFSAGEQQLPPGEVGRFQSEFAGPSNNADRVNVTFTNERPESGAGY